MCYSHTGLLGVPRGRAHTAHCWPPGHRWLHARRGGKRRVEGRSRTFAGDRRVLNGPVVYRGPRALVTREEREEASSYRLKISKVFIQRVAIPVLQEKLQLESLLVVRGRTACSARGGWLGAAGRAALLSY